MVPGAAWGVAIPGKAPFLLVLAVGVWDMSVAWEGNKVTHGMRVETGAGAYYVFSNWRLPQSHGANVDKVSVRLGECQRGPVLGSAKESLFFE